MRSIATLILAIAAFPVALAAQEPASDSALAESGAVLFVQNCAVCHGRGARGDGPAVPALSKRPADLTAIAARRGGAFPSDEIARFIDGRSDLPAHGSREMPIWGQHLRGVAVDPSVGEANARSQIAALVEYLRSIQRPPLAAREPAR